MKINNMLGYEAEVSDGRRVSVYRDIDGVICLVFMDDEDETTRHEVYFCVEEANAISKLLQAVMAVVNVEVEPE